MTCPVRYLQLATLSAVFISGAILDSSVVSPYMLDLAENGCLNHDRANVTLYHERIGFYWRKGNMGHAAMAAGTVGTPIYDFWSRRDRVCDCTEVGKLTVTDSEGNSVTDTGCNLQHGPFDDALEQHNPGGASRVHRVCVDDPKNSRWPCNLHSPTKFAAAETGGDRDHGGEDYNAVIFDWILGRLEGPLPEL